MNDSLPTALETLGAQLDEAWDRRYGRQARRGRAVAWARRNAVRLVVPVVGVLERGVEDSFKRDSDPDTTSGLIAYAERTVMLSHEIPRDTE